MSKSKIEPARMFLICQSVKVDAFTATSSLVDVAWNLDFQTFPGTVTLAAYFLIWRTHNEVEFVVRFVDSEDGDKVVWQQGYPTTFDADNPANTAEVWVHLLGVTFPHPGDYEAQLLMGGVVIGRQAVNVA